MKLQLIALGVGGSLLLAGTALATQVQGPKITDLPKVHISEKDCEHVSPVLLDRHENNLIKDCDHHRTPTPTPSVSPSASPAPSASPSVTNVTNNITTPGTTTVVPGTTTVVGGSLPDVGGSGHLNP